MTPNELTVGQKVFSTTKGEGVIIKKTPRTVSAKFDFSTTKWTYKKGCTLGELGITLNQ